MSRPAKTAWRSRYESFGLPSGDRLLLIIGTGAQMLFWSDAFCVALADRGFMVARSDNPNAGLSTHLSAAGVPSQLKTFTKPTEAAPYGLEDMADDAARCSTRWAGTLLK